MRKFLVAGAALGALTAGAAQAQVQQPGFYGFLNGTYIVDGDLKNVYVSPQLGGQGAGVGDGFGGRGQLGYDFGGWDVAAAFEGAFLSRGPRQASYSASTATHALDGGGFWMVDGEVGYNIRGPGYGVRPFVAVRYARWNLKDDDGQGGAFTAKMTSWGVGPRVGVDGSLRLTESISVFGGLGASALFGKTKTAAGGTAGVGSVSDSRVIWEFDGKAGLDWEIAPLWHLAAGYQFSVWNGVTPKQEYNGFGAALNAGRTDRLIHGPFVRLAYNWGAPPSGPMAPKPPVASGKKSYIVFFDFDRALITPTAATTIKQAAADAKAGKSTRLDVTGHADKSGGDAYNMALSLRRANAVKDQLVREGIPANQIAVVGRGESMPLVQTADGVREPQNRRVEIVLN
ncbi:MAG: OmpA family protein [Rhodospirillales bacterium]|nr:MAG: OmpA family protein [Rhodospirillales bacterium]